MADNFSFLTQKFPILAKFGSLAEQYLYSDPNSCMIKLRMLGETVVNLIFRYEKIAVDPELNAAKRIRLLEEEGIVDQDFADILHILRKKGNQAAHENFDSRQEAEICLRVQGGRLTIGLPGEEPLFTLEDARPFTHGLCGFFGTGKELTVLSCEIAPLY